MNYKKTLVLGASENPARYSNIAIQRLLQYKHPVVAVGNKNAIVNAVPITTQQERFEAVDTITLYLNPINQKNYYDYILAIKPKRIIFNPGTENEELIQLAQAKGIETIKACTLVMLATGQY